MVSRLIREALSRRAARFNMILDDVSLTHVTFSPAFADAVEAKQVASQTAQRAAYLVDQAVQEKQSIIVRAQVRLRHLSWTSASRRLASALSTACIAADAV